MSTPTHLKTGKLYKATSKNKVDLPKYTRTGDKNSVKPDILASFKEKIGEFEPGDFLPIIELENDLEIKKVLNNARVNVDKFLKKSGLDLEKVKFTTNRVPGTSIIGVWRKD